MFEALVLIAIIGLVAQFVHLKNRVTELEQDVLDLRSWTAAGWRAPEAEVEPEPVATEPAAPPESFDEPIEPEPAERHILYAGTRPTEQIEDISPVELHEPSADDFEREGESGRGFGFEDLFGRRLPIWAGGITLAIAGVLIVKLSIEAGLLSPPVRVMLGSIFGFALIGTAEVALRQEERVRDARVRQALSGAGLASLYATILVATNLYQLIPPVAAMFAMALVTGLAMLLSVRFGAPSALLGLVGGLAAPALVGSPEPNIPLLSVYLALAVGGLTALSRNQRWAWLGISALLGGFGWGIALLATGALDLPGTISLGLYILLLGIALPALGLAGERRDQIQLIAGVVAAAQMAALVATGGFSLVNWALFGLIAAAGTWLATREPKLALLPPIALIIGLLLLGAWPEPTIGDFVIVAVPLALIQGLVPLGRLWAEKGGILEAAQLSAILLGGWILAMLQFYREDGSADPAFGLLALGLGAAAAAIAGLGWRASGRQDDARFAIVATASAALFAAAASLLLPDWLVGVAIAAIGLALLHLGQMGEDRRLEPLAWLFAGAGFFTCIMSIDFDEPTSVAAARWGLAALASGLFAWRARLKTGRRIAQFASPILLYFALVPLIPDRVEPLIPPLLLAGAAFAGRALKAERLVPAMAASALMILLSAAEPLGGWIQSGVASLMGDPMLVGGVPDVEMALSNLLVPALLTGIAVWVAWQRLKKRERIAGVILAAALGTIGLHSLYKQLFAIGTGGQFVELGLAERTIWAMLLAGGGLLAMRTGRQLAGYLLAGAAAAHLAVYSLLIHNPLWTAQQVGSWPIVNLLLPVYGLAFALLIITERAPLTEVEGIGRSISITRMLLIALFAFSTLRQLFHGTLLTDPGLSQAEDIGRSLLAIALAIGFLLWGIRSRGRDWRIASLALMLGAVGKVFLLDAAGLEGVTRIGSFVALGFSLIGIGWLYSRHLSGDEPQLAKAGSSR